MSLFRTWTLQLLAGLTGIACLAAEQLPKSVKWEKSGAFVLDSYVKGYLLHFGPDWVAKTQNSLIEASGQPRTAAGSYHIEGRFPVMSGVSFQVVQDVTATGRDSFRYEAKLTASQAVECKFLSLALALPVEDHDMTVQVDGRPLVLSGKTDRKVCYDADAREILLTLPDGQVLISGSFKLFVQGKFPRDNTFAVRISPRNMPRQVKDWNLKLDFRFIPFPAATQALDLKPVANMGFKDARAGDGKGGWTDQGPDNDLSVLNPGKLTFSALAFNILDPAANQGKSCLVISGKQQKFRQKSVVKIDRASPAAGQYLYLLHACAWPPSEQEPIGKIIAEYSNGSRREIPVLNWRDCGNWWNPYRGANAALAWTGMKANTPVGLYCSRFYLGESPVSLTFESADTSVWMIVAGTLSARMVKPQQDQANVKVISAGKDWLPMEFTGKTVPGSPLDFSGYLDAPAGKYGAVIIDRDGHFAFRNAPDKRIRFFGPNLVGSANYLNKEQADDFVRKAVSLGYNTIRFHHFENGLIKRGATDSLTFDPAALDQLDYLFAELKKHGIYITIDLYASRLPRPGDGIDECRTFKRYEMKSLVPISASAYKNWQDFARKILTRRNPYTGLTWAEDPALYSLNLINENPLICAWRDCPDAIPLYEQKFAEHLKSKNLPAAPPQRDGLFIEFLNGLQSRCIEKQTRFLREELKLKALITDLNHQNRYSLAGLRDQLDFVDNHQYWDHPRFAGKRWDFPFIFTGSSAISQNAANPRGLMPTRVFGKPFTVTEFNFCNPNPYRMECAPLIGGYAGLQDWDGLYRFAWSHSRNAMITLSPTTHFDIVNNPQALLAERIIHMLFVRGDVLAARPAYAFTFNPGQIRELKGLSYTAGNYPTDFTELGLYARIGSISEKKTWPDVMNLDALSADWTKRLPQAAQNALTQLKKTGKITSSTGQITLNNQDISLVVCTPKSEVVTFKNAADGKIMKLRNAERVQTVAIMSLDNRNLPDSTRLLLLHLPNMAATGQKTTTGNRLLLESWGQLPLLLEKAKVNIELALPGPMKVERLKLDGSLNGAVPAEYQNGKVSFMADSAAKKGGVMAYLLTR